jgi:hypothetical protein
MLGNCTVLTNIPLARLSCLASTNRTVEDERVGDFRARVASRIVSSSSRQNVSQAT